MPLDDEGDFTATVRFFTKLVTGKVCMCKDDETCDKCRIEKKKQEKKENGKM